MNNQNAFTNFAAALGTAALILTSLAAAPRAAAQSIGNDWEQYGQMLVLDRTITTPAMQALGATIHSQKLSNPVRITFYKAKTASTDGFTVIQHVDGIFKGGMLYARIFAQPASLIRMDHDSHRR